MNSILLSIISLFYLLLLFVIATYSELGSKFKAGKKGSAYIYALSMAVYCTAWTYFGSVGNAAKGGIGFLPVYIGPSLMMPLLWFVLRKVIRIAKKNSISNIADFLSIRYGQNRSIGILASIFFFIGIIPYISLQIKAIDTSFIKLSNSTHSSNLFFKDLSFYIVIIITFFTILYGTRNIDITERRKGLMSAIAFESLVKLIAFISVGIFVSFYVFHSPADIFKQAFQKNEMLNLFSLQGNMSHFDWLMLILVSGLAIIMLPRQFQVAVVENKDENNIRQASWLFPLYLILINLFVLPIAIGGKLLLGSSHDADMYVLELPIHLHRNGLAAFVFLGGFAAASGMIIIETIALSIMLSNNIAIPLLIYINNKRKKSNDFIGNKIKMVRRITIIVILLIAYLYDKFIAENFPLSSIGFVSFVAVAQFAPAMLGGIYSTTLNKNGVISGILAGFSVWFFTLIIPSISNKFELAQHICHDGLFGLSFLKPDALLGLQGMHSISHAFFWSMLFNVLLLVTVSTLSKASSKEIFQANRFVNVYTTDEEQGKNFWAGKTFLKDIIKVLANIIGESRANLLINGYAERHKINLAQENTDSRIIQFAENILASSVGVSSADILIKNISEKNEISIDEALKILQENQKVLVSNKELRKRQNELTKVTEQLQNVNEQLKRMDEQKDEFLYTVTHELRTPLTSIRALSEILQDNPDLDEEQKQSFLGNIVSETERLSHLITQVLNLERFESGRQRLNTGSFSFTALLQDAIQSIQPIADQQKKQITTFIPNSQLLLHADSDLLMQVLNNLLSNALKFSDAEHGQITIRVFDSNNEIRCEIEDNGKGIERDVHELIFDKFFQAKNQTLKKPVGSGLGLAICKKIILSHEGKIWVESEVGKGSKFIFTLPN